MVCIAAFIQIAAAESMCSSIRKGYLCGSTNYQWIGKTEIAPEITIDLRHKKTILQIQTDEFGAYEINLDPGNYFVLRAYDANGKDIEFLLDQPRCIKVREGKKNPSFSFMLKPPSIQGGKQHQAFSQYDCESSDYGFLQGIVGYKTIGDFVRAPGVTIEFKGKGKTVFVQTDEYGEYLERLEPGKYSLISIRDGAGQEIELFTGQLRRTKVRKKDCARFYIELKQIQLPAP